jgi:hypothetical protein
MSFTKIDENVKHAINNFKNVSSRTATEINRIVKKGNKQKAVIIDLAEKIRDGLIGSTALEKIVDSKLIEKIKRKADTCTRNDLVFKKLDNNIQLKISKKINNIIESNGFDLEEFADVIEKYIESIK